MHEVHHDFGIDAKVPQLDTFGELKRDTGPPPVTCDRDVAGDLREAASNLRWVEGYRCLKDQRGVFVRLFKEIGDGPRPVQHHALEGRVAAETNRHRLRFLGAAV
jgi:hypothetical protein